MKKKIDPADFGLKSTVVLERESAGTVAILIDRKSRIIMKDGQRILEQAGKIREKEAGTTVKVKTSAPVCSKTRSFLEKMGIAVEAFNPGK